MGSLQQPPRRAARPPSNTVARSTTKLQLEDRGETVRLRLEMELPWETALAVLELVMGTETAARMNACPGNDREDR